MKNYAKLHQKILLYNSLEIKKPRLTLINNNIAKYYKHTPL